MSRQTNGTAYCNWVAFSKGVHDTLKEVPTIAADGLEVTESDFRWEYAVKKLTTMVFEPTGGIRGYHFFDIDAANDLVRSELERRKSMKEKHKNV